MSPWVRPDRAAVVFVLAAAGIALASTWHAHALMYRADGLPSWDAAGYLLEAVKVRDTIVGLDAEGFLKAATRPALHPPLHATLLGGWLSLFGIGIPAARAYPVACFLLSLGLIARLGRLLFPRGGWQVGMAAAAITALGAGSLELLATPMAESSALVAQLLAACAMVALADRRDARAQLIIGIGIFVCALIRYNLAPMLLAPMLAHHLLRNGRSRAALLDPRVTLWFLPTFVGFGAWQFFRPELFETVQKFLENRSSGIPFWSAENLLWVPLTIAREYLATWWVVAPLFAGFLASLLPSSLQRWRAPPEPESRAGEGRIAWILVVGFAALTWHDFKISRNLSQLLPMFYLLALGTLRDLRVPSGRWVGVAALLGFVAPYGAWQHRVTLADLAAQTDFQPDPEVRGALEFIERHARADEQVWVTGWVLRISPNLIDYWLRAREVPVKLKLKSVLYGTQDRTQIVAPWSEEYPAFVAGTMLAPNEVARTTYVTIETEAGTPYFDRWKFFGNHYARAMAAQEVVPEIDRLERFDAGLVLRAYHAGGTPSAASIAARATGSTEDDNVGVKLPPAVPLYRDTLARHAPNWQVNPRAALSRFRLGREGSALTADIDVAIPQLQLCGEIVDAPAPRMRAVFNLATRGVRGRVWVHVRGMGVDDKLQRRSDGVVDITRGGPLAPDGAQVIEQDVALGPDSPRLRACVILDGVTGHVSVQDFALFEEQAPAIPVGP